MRVLITGAGGLVGGALATELLADGTDHDVHGVVRTRPAPAGVVSHRLDLAEPGAFAALVDGVEPDLVIHCAYSLADLDRDVVAATEQVAQACASAAVGLVHLSTDALFDGDHAPYAEDDVPEPIHPYGVAKRRAELAVVEAVPDAAIVRTALIAHLVEPADVDPVTRWVLDAQARGENVTLFEDEIRSVVRLVDLVAAVVELVGLDPAHRRGIWHVAGPERLSRWDLGQILADRYGLDRSLLIRGQAASMGQPRPRDVSLSCDRMVRELSIRPLPVATVPAHGQATG